MSRMSDQPLTRAVLASVLADFHRDVVSPDIRQVVGAAVEGSERRLRDEMHTLHDAVLKRLDHLDHEDIRGLEQRIKPSPEG